MRPPCNRTPPIKLSLLVSLLIFPLLNEIPAILFVVFDGFVIPLAVTSAPQILIIRPDIVNPDSDIPLGRNTEPAESVTFPILFEVVVLFEMPPDEMMRPETLFVRIPTTPSEGE